MEDCVSETSFLLIGGAIGFVSAVLSPIIVEPLKNYLSGPKIILEIEPARVGYGDNRIDRVEIC